MAKVSFAYTQFPLVATDVFPAGKVIFRPYIFATVTSSGGEWLRIRACVDSGADSCMFPLSAGRALKLDLLRLPRSMTGGVGTEENITYFDTVRIDLGNGIAFQAYVGFTAGMDKQGIGLLGQDGFFSSFDVGFSHSRRIFTIDGG